MRYWRNLGDGRFDLPRFMQEAPAGLALAEPGVQFIDANGDGRTDLLVTNALLSGYFPLDFGGQWDHRILPALLARRPASTLKTRKSNWSISTATA